MRLGAADEMFSRMIAMDSAQGLLGHKYLKVKIQLEDTTAPRDGEDCRAVAADAPNVRGEAVRAAYLFAGV